MKHEPDYQLIARHLTGQSDPADARKLADWREASAENERCYRQVKTAWQETEAPSPERAFDSVAGWHNLATRLSLDDGPVAKPPPQRGRIRFFPKPSLLAVAAVCCLGLLGFYLWQRGDTNWHEIATQAMQRKTVSLADGSIIELNAGSQLRWREGLPGEIREVHFQGQGYFQVAAGTRPFIVVTENARVRVLGTAFEVWARNRATRVTVREGRVSLAGNDGRHSVLLTADQSAKVGGGEDTRVETVDAAALLGWREGRLVFRQQRLEDVIFDLEQFFGVELALNHPQLADRKVTASFAEADFETVLTELCLALNLDYVSEKNQTVIYEK